MKRVSSGTLIAAVVTASLCAAVAHAARTPPRGSYQASCSQVALSNGGILSGQCRSSAGSSVASALNVADCGAGDIANRDGQLVCQPAFGPVARNGPLKRSLAAAGNGAASITLFEAPNFKGRQLELSGDIDRLDRQHFNDLAASVRVKGGEWQVCADAVYRGRCVVLRKDVADLGRRRLTRQLSSVRRTG